MLGDSLRSSKCVSYDIEYYQLVGVLRRIAELEGLYGLRSTPFSTLLYATLPLSSRLRLAKAHVQNVYYIVVRTVGLSVRRVTLT